MSRPAVCHVLEASGGGVARHVVDLAREQHRRGSRVAIIANPRRTDEVSRAEFARLPDEGVPVKFLDMERSVSLRDMGAAVRLRSAIHSLGRFDVVHGHSSKAGALTRALISIRLGRAAKIYTPHALYTMDPHLGARKRALFVRIERALARRCDRIILVSTQEHDHARSIGLPPAKLVTIQNGVVLAPTGERVAARAALGLPDGQSVIGFVGRFSAQKDPVGAVEAFRRFLPRHPDATLVMVGDGELRGEVEQAADGLPVRLLGLVDAKPIFPAFDAFLLSSRYEACCYVILEALANAVPVATTPVGDSAAAIREGENGALAPVEDYDALADALDRTLALDRAPLRDLSPLDAWGIPRMVDRTDAAYGDALAGRRTKRLPKAIAGSSTKR